MRDSKFECYCLQLDLSYASKVDNGSQLSCTPLLATKLTAILRSVGNYPGKSLERIAYKDNDQLPMFKSSDCPRPCRELNIQWWLIP